MVENLNKRLMNATLMQDDLEDILEISKPFLGQVYFDKYKKNVEYLLSQAGMNNLQFLYLVCDPYIPQISQYVFRELIEKRFIKKI